jgi:hypothetical protein
MCGYGGWFSQNVDACLPDRMTFPEVITIQICIQEVLGLTPTATLFVLTEVLCVFSWYI